MPARLLARHTPLAPSRLRRLRRRVLLLLPLLALVVAAATLWHAPWIQPVLGVLLALVALSWSIARHTG